MKKLILIWAYLLLPILCIAVDIGADEFNGYTIWYVHPGQSIQQAIDNANNEDVIIVSPGTYVENIDFRGKAITVRSTNPDDFNIVETTIIDGNQPVNPDYGSVVTFDNGEGRNSILKGFTITGGTGTWYNSSNLWGGGIFCNGSSPTISHNIIVGNIGVHRGGGAYSRYGNPLLYKNKIMNNSAGSGGAIYMQGQTEFCNNVVCYNNASRGGGLYIRASGVIVANNMVYANNATFAEAGGIKVHSCSPVITGNTIVGNSCVGDGAANLSIHFSDNVTVANNIIADAVNCVGVYLYDSSVVFKYNDVWNNQGGNYDGMPDPTGTNGNISNNPLFVNPDVNDYHLQPTSPCINAGDPDYVPEPNETDIDGQDRIYALRMDIGADEYVGYLPPMANAGPDQFLLETELVTLDGSGSFFYDPDGIVEFHWEQIDGVPVTLSDPNAMQPTFIPEAEDEYRFELVVSDGLNTSEPDEVLIVIGNRAPVADAGAEILVQVPETVTLDGSGSFDPDPSDEISYWWRQVAGPNVPLSDPNTATPSFQCIEQGAYRFELIVYDGLAESVPSEVNVITYELRLTQGPLNPSLSTGHYPDISGGRVVYGAGPACDYTWDIKCMETGHVSSFASGAGSVIDTQPKIDGDILVWFGGIRYRDPWGHEPSNTSILVRNLATDAQKTLRKYTMSKSYSHPVVSGNKVVWLEHLGLDTNPKGSDEANNWWNTPYNVCGADISDWSNPTYFTIAENVGTRDPYPCHTYTSDFDDVIDISGNIVVWEGNGDIYGADISDLNDIRVFTICDAPYAQFDPAISGNIVLWTDTRNDSGDIYGADLSDLNDIRVFEVARQPAKQEQPAIDRHIIVYVDVQDGLHMGPINVCCLPRRHHAVIHIQSLDSAYGAGPAIDGETIVWQSNDYWSGKIGRVSLELSYTIADGPVENLDTGERYDYIQMAINDANSGDHLEAQPGQYFESVNFKDRNLTVRSTNPNDAAVVAATVIDSENQDSTVTFSGGEDANCVLTGFTITGGSNRDKNGAVLCLGEYTSPVISNCIIARNAGVGIYCDNQATPTITNCIIAGNSGPGITAWGRESATITNCTIVENRAEGIYSPGGTPTITNCIIWDNEGDAICGGAYVTYSNIEGGYTGAYTLPGNIDADPCFVELGYWDANGLWVDGDYHLLPTSPCINAGDPNYVPEPNETDLDGNPRIDGGRIDMGAYETVMHQARLWIRPRIINRKSHRPKWITAWMYLPAGISKEQVDKDTPLTLYPGGIKAARQFVLRSRRRFDKRTRVLAFFNRDEFLDAVDTNGLVQLQVFGFLLEPGQYFHGSDRIIIIDPRPRPWWWWRWWRR